MKSFSKKIILLCGILFAGFALQLSAQTDVSIYYHYEYSNQSCTVPATWNFSVDAQTYNYAVSDNANIYIDFGDGNFTNITVPQSFYDATHAYANMGSYAQHTYNTQGNYSVVYIVTMPDGNADTLTFNVMVTPVCNNVTGRLYVDANSDCIFNAGDVALPGISIRLDYNTSTISTNSTDAQGLFTLTACPGYSYSLLTDTSGYYSPTFDLTCSTFNGMAVTPSPNATQDLVAATTPTVHVSYASDSTNFISGNCAPLNAFFYVEGGSFGYVAPDDTMDVYINFGDGTDTTVSRRSYSIATTNVGSYAVGMQHNYTAVGNYNVLYVVTGPDGANDSAINYNQIIVSDTCGNIEGNIYLDNNSNCVYDAGDSSTLYAYVMLTNTATGIQSYVFTDANGHYSFSTSPGNYTVSIAQFLNNSLLVTTCPSSGVSNVTVTASNSSIADFGVICSGSHDFYGGFGVWPGIWPTYQTHMHTYVYDHSCTPNVGSVSLILDPLVLYLGVCDSIMTPVVNGDTLTWNFNSNNSYSNWYYWFSNTDCLLIKGDPSLQLGDTVCITMIINPISGDINPTNNTITRCIPALVSMDPNVKSVSPRGTGPLGYVPQQTTFDYRIDFQNTGTAMARNIFVLDTLDSDLDLSTLAIIGSSHLMQPQILPGNILKFKFDDINLPDSTTDESNSHGFVSYRIAAKPALADGTPIQNKAGIYFDFNAPVITNSTLNTIHDPASVHEIVSVEATIFPNPASSNIEITFNEEKNGTISLTDLTGKIVYSTKFQGRSSKVDVSTLPQGCYLLILETTNGRTVHKVVVQH